ncbi:hypothetical protein LguiB_026681 [Lonicera macranthoides]
MGSPSWAKNSKPKTLFFFFKPKISHCATKIILASSLLPETLTLNHRLKSFESSVGLSQKAFCLGKFVQEINSLRISKFDSNQLIALSLLAYLGEGTYYFVEQFFWFAKSGLIDAKCSCKFARISAWAELIGYFKSIGLKIRDLKGILEDETCLVASIEISVMREVECEKEREKLRKLREKKLLKKFSLVQDMADG